jgi:probable phosphoglycerate mutase
VRKDSSRVLKLVRHGQSESNAAGLLVGRTDSDLSDNGRSQAQRLQGRLGPVSHLVVSPLTRTLQTAALAAPDAELHVDEAFIELDYGSLEGRPVSDVSAEQWAAFASNPDVALGGGESVRDVDRRVHGRLNEWSSDPLHPLHEPERHVVVVSHVSPIKSAVAWALGVDGLVAVPHASRQRFGDDDRCPPRPGRTSSPTTSDRGLTESVKLRV